MITIDKALELYENDELDEARKAFQILAQEGDSEAQYRLGMLASYGEGQPEDPVLAAKHYRIAAEAGHMVAQYCLAVFYARGRGVEQDYQQALRWYQAAAEGGDADAIFNLGIMYARGQGTPVDVEKAVIFWKQAAALGQVDAMFELGNAFRDRVAGQADMVEASEWYLRAWKKHHERAYDAVLAIVPQLERCAEEGYALAFYNLGVIYKFALDDNAKAFRWFFQGAELEHPKCVKALGDCYREGEGVEADPAAALSYYEKAADLGDPVAQYQVGRSYSEGEWGQQHDIDRAIFWYGKAGDNGLPQGHIACCKMLAVRNRGIDDAREVVRRLCALAAAGEPGKTYSISAADGAWGVVVSDQGASVGVSGIDMEPL